MAEHQDKGRALEQAVKFIQETILKSDPKFSGIKFSIEANKVAIIGDVRHEIDVLVKTLPASTYESAWIFECKNWKEPVGKNEVIVLAEKVKALGANRGFLVARALSRYAEAQLKLDNRLSYVPCNDDFLSPLNDLELVHLVHEPQTVEVHLKERGVPTAEHPEVRDWKEWKGKKCRLNNVLMDFPSYLQQEIRGLVSRDQKENFGDYELEGTYARERAEEILFERSEFAVESMDVECMVLVIRFTVAVRRRKILSKFELKDQARYFAFEPIDDFIPGKRLDVVMVQRL